MTLKQIIQEANERYPMKGCRLEKREQRRLKKIFIQKKIREFGLKVELIVNKEQAIKLVEMMNKK